MSHINCFLQIDKKKDSTRIYAIHSMLKICKASGLRGFHWKENGHMLVRLLFISG